MGRPGNRRRIFQLNRPLDENLFLSGSAKCPRTGFKGTTGPALEILIVLRFIDYLEDQNIKMKY